MTSYCDMANCLTLELWEQQWDCRNSSGIMQAPVELSGQQWTEAGDESQKNAANFVAIKISEFFMKHISRRIT